MRTAFLFHNIRVRARLAPVYAFQAQMRAMRALLAWVYGLVI